MKRSRIAAALVLGTLVLVAAGWNRAEQPADDAEPLSADSPPAAAEPSRPVVLLDVSRVFEKYPAFIEKMVVMKEEVEQAEAAVQTRREEIKSKLDQLGLLEVGSLAHTALQNESASAQAQLAADIALQKQRFVLKEASIYADAYADLEAACEEYARTRGIGAILRISGDAMNRSDPKSVLSYLNRDVVWHDGRLDITREILDLMTARARAKPPAAEPAGQPDGDTPSPEPTDEVPEPPTAPGPTVEVPVGTLGLGGLSR